MLTKNKSWNIGGIGITLLLLLTLAGCKSENELRRSDYDFSNKEDDVQLLRVDTLSGYLYNFYQEKCPGTTISERNSPCMRLGFIYSRHRISEYENVISDDSLNISDNQLYALDYEKAVWVVPGNLIPSYSTLSNEKRQKISTSENNALTYSLKILYDYNAAKPRTLNKTCHSDTYRKFKIVECKLDTEVALLFSIKKGLARYVTSPDIGIGNYGMPLKSIPDTMTVAWFVPRDSFFLDYLPD